jgi:Flp pilus assembly protein CpaB
MHRFRRRSLPRLGTWPRLLVAGTCVLLALSSALGARRGAPPPSPQSVAVVVAERDLPAGRVLTRHDVALVRLPVGLRPAGARADPDTVVGRRLAGAVTAREPITSPRLLGPDLATGLGAGLVVTAVALADPHTLDLVRPGDRIDLLEAARPPDFADLSAPVAPRVRTAVTRAAVLAVLPAANDAAAEVIVAVDRATAVRITRDSATNVFTPVIDPP